MPTKILTDQPATVRDTLGGTLTTSDAVLVEAHYYSIPLIDEDTAVVDPADNERELRAGEVFLLSDLEICNTSGLTRSVRVQIITEAGTVLHRVFDMVIPANETLAVPPGLSLFKRDLANPTNAGAQLRARADGTGVEWVMTVAKREALADAPDTEGI